MLSKIAALGFITKTSAVGYNADGDAIYAASLVDGDISHNANLGCKECLMGGFTYCVNTPWFYF